MKTESLQQLTKEYWEASKQFGEYGKYIATHGLSMPDSQLKVFTQMHSEHANRMKELEFKINQTKV